MKVKTSLSKMCVLLAIIFFINPVFATADALFSHLNLTQTVLSSQESPSGMPCHDEKNTDVLDMQNMNVSEMASDCCADICQCDDSGCHTSSLVFQSKSSLIYNVNQTHQYQLPIYLSLAFTPSSPPPII